MRSDPAPHAPATGEEPDWKALYLELGTAVSDFFRVCRDLEADRADNGGRVDGGDFWTAYGNMERLYGQALCWRELPDVYAEALKRQAAARAMDATGAEPGAGGRS